MNREEVLAVVGAHRDPPVRLADGAMGLLIRYGADEAGVQVPGEEDIRWIPYARLHDLGGGALIERAEGTSQEVEVRGVWDINEEVYESTEHGSADRRWTAVHSETVYVQRGGATDQAVQFLMNRTKR